MADNAYEELSQDDQEIVYNFFDGMSKHDAITTFLAWADEDTLKGIIQAFHDASQEDDDARSPA